MFLKIKVKNVLTTMDSADPLHHNGYFTHYVLLVQLMSTTTIKLNNEKPITRGRTDHYIAYTTRLTHTYLQL